MEQNFEAAGSFKTASVVQTPAAAAAAELMPPFSAGEVEEEEGENQIEPFTIKGKNVNLGGGGGTGQLRGQAGRTIPRK